MKQITFLVAFVTLLQIAAGSQAYSQERLPGDATRSVEEALELAGKQSTHELEAWLRQLEQSAERIGRHLDRWAEEHSEELDAWSDKYARQWESWGERFGQKMERLAAEQESVWALWAEGFRQDLDGWTTELESGELTSKQWLIFARQNLETLGKMPVGQLVDQALEEGLGQLGEAPLESLEELGELAKSALEAPLRELSEILDENSEHQKAIERDRRETADHEDRAPDQTPRVTIQNTDPIKKKFNRKKERQRKLPSPLSMPGSRTDKIQEFNQKSKQLESRLPKRADGKSLVGSSKQRGTSSQDATPRFQRDGRDGKANRKPASKTNRNALSDSGGKFQSELELLRVEIARLRGELKKLKQESDK